MNNPVAKKKSTMTLELERETLAELKAAVIIFGAKSYSSLVHQQVVLKIREARQMVSKEEFEKLVAEQMQAININSEKKSLERKKSLKTQSKKETTPAAKKATEPAANLNSEKVKVAAKKPGKGKDTLTTGTGKTYQVFDQAEKFEDDEQ